MTGAPDYYKSILLYGLYNGKAVPLACDEQGRLILIAEQVSPFDKSGTILVHDEFGDGLVHVQTSTDGTGAGVSLDGDEAFAGAYSCKITGPSDGLLRSGIIFRYSPSEFNKLGVQFSARLGSPLDKYELWLYVYTGTEVYAARVIYDPGDDAWSLYDYAAGDWVPFLEGVDYDAAVHYFYTFKFTVDIINTRYGSFKHPSGVVDLSSYTIYQAEDATVPAAVLRIFAYSPSGQNGELWIDQVILTQDES